MSIDNISTDDWEKQSPSDNKFAQQILGEFIHVNERGLFAMVIPASEAIRAMQKYHSKLSAPLYEKIKSLEEEIDILILKIKTKR